MAIASSILKKRIRYDFGKTSSIAGIPDLIRLQKESYEDFLQISIAPEKRKNRGMEAIFSSIFPVDDLDGRATVEYLRYSLGSPKYEMDECVQRGVSYTSPLLVVFRLIVWDIDRDSGTKEVRSIKEQEVYIGDVPLMTEEGTFVINGAQRVIVSQMHRSPGAFYFHDDGKSNVSGKYLYAARIIPYRGSWLDFEFDVRDLVYFRVDRKRKLPITLLFKAMGFTKEQILEEFYKFRLFSFEGGKWQSKFDVQDFVGSKSRYDVKDSTSGEILVQKGIKFTDSMARSLQKRMEGNDIYYGVSEEDIIGCYVAENIIDPTTGEVMLEAGGELTPSVLHYILEVIGYKDVKLLNIDKGKSGGYIRNTLILDKVQTQQEALYEFYRVLKASDPVSVEVAQSFFHETFFAGARYDLSAVGRMKLNMKHDLTVSESVTWLTKEDILVCVKHLVKLRDGLAEIDDIDSLGNRRIRPVGELIENQFRIALVRMERSLRERMVAVEADAVMLHEIISSKSLASVVNEFFGTSQLSQFMDQVNPLAEITHKRRVSALGQGGLTRGRAGFEVRDVHPTHYGRICPIETPEGQNIGLINSLATYARVNKYGFVESPYRKVIDGKVTDQIVYLSAMEEEKYTIAQAGEPLMDEGSFVNEEVSCRRKWEFVVAPPTEVDYMDVSSKQLVSVAASLVPFLENDDASRALMGSNMQRQAVPLVQPEAPLVGTGIEGIVAKDSGVTVVALRDGVVDKVDAARILVKTEMGERNAGSFGVDVYKLAKYRKTNQGTCINQTPLVNIGDIVKAGDVIADGSCTELGELALGKNILVAFIPWNGYTFEDSILVSESLVRNRSFSSIHIQEYEVIARDTRLGPEEITRDIPNVAEEYLVHLDESGIVRIGAELKAGDIIVGKVAPKTESPLTPEEKLLRAIFGEKSADVRDSSLRLPPGESGTVIHVRQFTRRGVDKNERAILLEKEEIDRLEQDHKEQLGIVEYYVSYRAIELLRGKVLVSGVGIKEHECGIALKESALQSMRVLHLLQLVVDDAETMQNLKDLKTFWSKTRDELELKLKHSIFKVRSGDDLPQGALKVVKVCLATNLNLQPGDKLAGRHGNKGVISKICPIEDMPFLEDGTPVDMILNPLGVPSRMNIGQILETHLGWASVNIGKQINSLLNDISCAVRNVQDLRSKLIEMYGVRKTGSPEECGLLEYLGNMSDAEILELGKNLRRGLPFSNPVFEGAKEQDLDILLNYAGVDTSGQVNLIDGKTGEPLKQKVTVGYIYMMKLDHLVENKMHARSTGPYSLVTQQPLGGKSHFGGQRFGEMECWALQAYGASYTLQEMLTIKSDDVEGRVKAYELIVKGDDSFGYAVPESFNVMIKELRSLCLNMEMLEEKEAGEVSNREGGDSKKENDRDQKSNTDKVEGV